MISSRVFFEIFGYFCIFFFVVKEDMFDILRGVYRLYLASFYGMEKKIECFELVYLSSVWRWTSLYLYFRKYVISTFQFEDTDISFE